MERMGREAGRKRRTADGRKRITRRCYVTAVYGGRFKMAGWATFDCLVYLEIEGGGWIDGWMCQLLKARVPFRLAANPAESSVPRSANKEYAEIRMRLPWNMYVFAGRFTLILFPAAVFSHTLSKIQPIT